MTFNLERSIRVAGSAIVIAGLVMSSWTAMLVGNVFIAVGYMMSIGKIEKAFEKMNDAKIETEDN